MNDMLGQSRKDLLRTAKLLGFQPVYDMEERSSKPYCNLYKMNIDRDYCENKCQQKGINWKCNIKN